MAKAQPQEYQRMFLAGLFMLNIWMRPRPAVLPGDPEVQIKKELKREHLTDDDDDVLVERTRPSKTRKVVTTIDLTGD